jgi:GNAT superfamily N-acetyltransferase
MTVTIELAPRDDATFAQVFTIYRDVIEPSEQKTRAELRAAFGRSDYRIIVARENGAIVGFAMGWTPAGERYWLLEYLAVDRSQQGKGLGAALFSEMLGHAGPGSLALVEADDDAGTSGMQRRRLDFYARLGCRALKGISYLLPLETSGVPPPMLLLVHALGAIDSIPRETVRGWLARIYVEVYAQRADDPRIARMLAGLPEHIALTPPATPS